MTNGKFPNPHAWEVKMAAVVWRLVLFLAVCISAGHCLYEDEIGRTDWCVSIHLNSLHCASTLCSLQEV